MSHYYVPDNDRELAEKLIKTNVCAECGRRLYVYMDTSKPHHPLYVACSDQHEHIAKEYQPSRFQEEGLDALTLEAREETMNEQYGKDKGQVLVKSGVPLSGRLDQSQAMVVLRLVYPDVPDNEIVRTAILCRDFGLHPLMKEVYIIPFIRKQKDGTYKEEWSTVLGINATRKMMARQGSFSYIDNTPRVMTEQEQKDIFGEVVEGRITAITKLQTRDGLNAQGYGHYLLKDTPYGMDKGNTRANQAFIRSERQAFSRLFPDAIPQNIEIVDEAYVEGIGKVDQLTGEIKEGEEKEAEPPSAKKPAKKAIPPDEAEQPELPPVDPNKPVGDLSDPQAGIQSEQLHHLSKITSDAGSNLKALAKWFKDVKGWDVPQFSDLKVWQYLEIIEAYIKGM